MDPHARRLASIQRHLLGPSAHHHAVCSSHTTAEAATSTWQNVPMAPPDPILGVTDAFKKDGSSAKINLGVGAYRTEEGKPLVLQVVQEAERMILADHSLNKEYLPIGGLSSFCKASAKLAFGEDSAALASGRVATVQALSGTGALRIAAEFISRFYPNPVIYLPNPTWGNHKNIFPAGGVKALQYRYYDAATRGLNIQGMLDDLAAAPDGSVVLLHACAHNPTGVDPTPEQWDAILSVVQRKRHLPLFDSAYQGFASGCLNRDAWAVRAFESAGVELLLCQSYAKNMGLYGERVGALSVVCSSADNAKRVESQLKQVIRPMYSNPPMHGALIASTILNNPRMMTAWRAELKGMADRIIAMRTALHDALERRGVPGDWSHILKQIGMFTFTGLTPKQVENMTGTWHVYMTKDGRISMAGLSAQKCDYLAQAIQDSVRL